MAQREIHGRMVEIDPSPDSKLWKYVFNSSLRRWGWQGEAQAGAIAAGYEYYTWSGWVYYVTTGLHAGVLEEELV